MALATSPPGPEGTYLVGNLLEYARDPLSFLTRCSLEYGDVVRLRFPGPPVYLLNGPDHVEQVLVKNNRNVVKGTYFRQELGFLGRGLLTSEGEFWRRQRRLSQPAFHRERINAYGEVVVSYAQRMLEGWRGGRKARCAPGDDAPALGGRGQGALRHRDREGRGGREGAGARREEI